MTIIEAINQVDSIKPNSYSQSDKIEWLSRLDGLIKKHIIDTHEGGESVTFNGYDDLTPIDTKLIVEAPYDAVYLSWLEAKIDYANGEFAKYNNSATAYNTDYSAFERYYNRTHMPLGKKTKFF